MARPIVIFTGNINVGKAEAETIYSPMRSVALFLSYTETNMMKVSIKARVKVESESAGRKWTSAIFHFGFLNSDSIFKNPKNN
jgi:hypothetical protein